MRFIVLFVVLATLVLNCNTLVKDPATAQAKSILSGGSYQIFPDPILFSDDGDVKGSRIKPVKLMLNGTERKCLSFVGQYMMLERVWYQHEPNSNTVFAHASCEGETVADNAKVQWLQVEFTKEAVDNFLVKFKEENGVDPILPSGGIQTPIYAYVKLAEAPVNNPEASNRNTGEREYTFMGMLYHSADALEHEGWRWEKKSYEETFLGFLKTLKLEDVKDSNGSLDGKIFTRKFLELMDEVFLNKMLENVFHHFQGPFALNQFDRETEWHTFHSGFQEYTVHFKNNNYQHTSIDGRTDYCLSDSNDKKNRQYIAPGQGFIITKKIGNLECAPVNVITADTIYYYKVP